MVDDPELLELVELEVRELLTQVRVPGRRHPDHPRQRAQGAAKATQASWASRRIHEADGRGGQLHSEPKRDVDKPFLMPVEDVFSISGRGTVATGRVERGKVKVGEEVEIVGIKATAKTVVTGVEMFRKLLDEGRRATTSAALLRGVEAGGHRARPGAGEAGSITPHTKFKAEVVRADEGRGRPSHAVLQRLSAAVLLPDDGRDGRVRRCRRARRW